MVNNFSFNILYFFFKKLFYIVPVPKHKQLLFLIRNFFKIIKKQTKYINSLNVTFRGKLAATGNKRKSSFSIILGKGASAQLNVKNITDFRLIRTSTGVLGVTSIITYTR